MTRGLKFTSRPSILLGYALLALGVVFTQTGCSPGCRTPSEAPSSEQASPSQKRPYGFDYLRVTSFMLAKQWPETGERWSGRFRRTDSSLGSPGSWEVAAGPDVDAVPDRRADGRFIEHLLDTLRSVEVQTDEVPKGELASYGLEPPRYFLTWEADHQTFELQLGDCHPQNGACYARVAGSSQVRWVRGAVFGMLGHLKGFETLRLRRLADFEADDVYFIELREGARLVAQGERVINEWIAPNKKPHPESWGAWLDRVTHLQVVKFANPQDAAFRAVADRLQKAPALLLGLHGRGGKKGGEPREVRFVGDSGKLWASVSTRPNALFEVDASALKWLGHPGQ